MPTVEVCLSPALYPYLQGSSETLTVVIDILRATTSFCTAFDYGVDKIIPLNSIEEAKARKAEGHLVAAEREGLKPEFADFSNSAFDYMTDLVKGKTIYYTTTNGTEAIRVAKEKGKIAIASFLNYPAIANWLQKREENIVLLCAGWKNNFCIEDTLCAGAIARLLLQNKRFSSHSDSTDAAILLWNNCNNNPKPLIARSAHYNRLLNLGYGGILDYSLKSGISNCIPIMYNNVLIDFNKNHNIYY